MSNTSGPSNPNDPEIWTSVVKLSKDLRKAAATMSHAEARFLVDNYYAMQRSRIRAAGQVRSMPAEPHETLEHLTTQSERLEDQTKAALAVYVEAHPIGKWLMGIVGIGPVISAGLLAHIDITKAPTVGHIWAFAGLDPTRTWAKGQKRPHNSMLKVICWKAGESFVKNCNREGCFYGEVYKERKELENARNDQGMFSSQAADILKSRNYKKDTDAYAAYSKGKLPPAHIHARARRYAVKLFLAHLHEEMYIHKFGSPPPLPYPISHMGHAHKIDRPNPTPITPAGNQPEAQP